jgi:hypothetical protein
LGRDVVFSDLQLSKTVSFIPASPPNGVAGKPASGGREESLDLEGANL